MRNDSIQKTFLVAAGVCLVCSILVSTAAVNLQPVQALNKVLDKKKNILIAGGLWDEGKTIDELFQQVETRVVDLESGSFVDDIDAETYDQTEAVKDPSRSVEIPGGGLEEEPLAARGETPPDGVAAMGWRHWMNAPPPMAKPS